ncbi:MAG: CDP-alcohol phosphatidyltransferase family protein [Sedimentisphaerales bacterium]|nr:CDP-alcohol phosphatidyltransferase family protein [Sedimentisphaerales bacterium]
MTEKSEVSPFLRKLPNLITGSRLFFTAGFLTLLLMVDRHELADPATLDPQKWKLDGAFILFIIAGLTDIIDGPLARRYKITSQFGRSFDPLMDKILIAGGFITLAMYPPELTALAWWMVAVILAREILVTIIRHISENKGIDFRATSVGKLKMFLQSLTIGTIIFYLAHCQGLTWAGWVRSILVYFTVAFTAFSAVVYLLRLRVLFKK